MNMEIPCPANTLRGQLKHTWLENQILRVDTDILVSRWKKGVWLDTLNTAFPRRFKQALELADGLSYGFSPEQLVDQISPLNSLSDKLRCKVKKAVHETYLSATNIASLETPLRDASLSLQKEFNILINFWDMPQTLENETLIRKCWENIHAKSKTLHTLLEKLPKGVVLP